MSLFALAASVFLSQTSDPWDRAETALAAAKGLTAKMSFSIGTEKPATGTLALRSPDLVQIRLAAGPVDFEYIQGPRASVYYDHRARTYQWWPWYPEAMPPPTTGQMCQLSFPQYLMQGSLKMLGPKSGWSTIRREKVGGSDADVITSIAPTGHKNTLWIDDLGHVLRHEALFQQQESSLKVTAEYTDVVYSQVSDDVFAIDLPAGYEPESAPRLNDTAVVGQRVKLTHGRRLPEEASEELGDLGAMAPVMVLVTSEDLEPSPDGETWPKLASEAKGLGIGFVQVWVGQKPKFVKAAWTQYWDSDGSLEQRLGPPVTPYMYVIQKGVVVSGWQGKVGGRLTAVKKALFGPFRQKSDD